MKQRRHTPEQVIRKLREADRLLGEGEGVGEVCRQLEVFEPTYHRWRNRYGEMKADDVKRLKELERENARLQRALGLPGCRSAPLHAAPRAGRGGRR